MCNEQVEFSYRDRGIYIYLYKHNDFDSNMYTESERTSEYSAYRNISKILMTRINNIQGKTANWKRKMKRMKRTNEPNVFCILYLYAGSFFRLYIYGYATIYTSIYTCTRECIKYSFSSASVYYNTLYGVSLQSDAYSLYHIFGLFCCRHCIFVCRVQSKTNQRNDERSSQTNECTNERTNEKYAFICIHIFIYICFLFFSK